MSIKKQLGMCIFTCLLALVLFYPARNVSAQSAHSIKLTWNYTQGADPATGFVVQRATSASGPWTMLTATPIPVSTLTYSDTTGVGGTAYFYQVYALDSLGFQSPSDTLSTSVVFLANPAAPTGLAAVAN